MKTWEKCIKALREGGAREIFVYTMICGLLAHGLAVFNKQPFYDDVMHAFEVSPTQVLASGRWLRVLMTSFVARCWGGSNLSLPLLHGIGSLCCIAASAWLVAQTFDIRNKVQRAILCGLMVAFPVVTGTFAYMFTAPYYFVSLLLSVAAVRLIAEKPGRKHFLAASACVCFSLAIYQAYLSVTVSLIVILLFFEIVDGRYASLWDMIKRGLYGAGTCVVGFGVYFAIWQILMRVLNIAERQYQAFDKIGEGGLSDYLISIATTYRRFFLFFEDEEENLYPMILRKVQWVVIALCILAGIFLIIRQLKKNKALAAMLLVLLAVLPVCMNLVYLMGASTASEEFQTHSLMLYGQCMLYVFLLCAIKRVEPDKRKPVAFVRQVAVAMLVLMVAGNIYLDNACYFKAEVMVNQAIADAIVMVGRIKSLEGYHDKMRVCLVVDGKRDASLPKNTHLAAIQIKPYDLYYIHPYHIIHRWMSYLEYYGGFAPKLTFAAYLGHEDEIKDMTVYPDDGSIRIIDDTVVIRW